MSKAESTRRERLEAAQREVKKKERRRSLIIWGSAALVVLVLVAGVVVVIVRDATSRPNLHEVQTYQVTANHVNTPVVYEQQPPVGGDHNPVWLNCGIYDEPVPNQHAVHSLEHGAVWVTYRPDLPEADVQKLAGQLPDTFTLLSPYPDLPAPVVISSWGRQLHLEGPDDPRLAEYVREYRLAPDTPELGAACTGGTGNPL